MLRARLLFDLLYLSCTTTVIESIVRGIQGLPLRQQIEVARHVYRLNATAQQERADARRIEAHG